MAPFEKNRKNAFQSFEDIDVITLVLASVKNETSLFCTLRSLKQSEMFEEIANLSIISAKDRKYSYGLWYEIFKSLKLQSKAPVSQLVNAELNSGNRKTVLQSNYTLQLRIRGCHAGMKCDLKGIKQYSHCVWLCQDSKYKSYLTRKP